MTPRRPLHRLVLSSVVIASMSIFAAPAPASAAELTMIAAGAVRNVLDDAIADYRRRTGHTFKLTVGPTGFLRDTIASGKHADLIIASAPLMAELEKTEKIVAGSRIDIGRVGLGVVVRAGAPLPDVSTPEAVKQALINAKSIAYTDPKLGGTSVEHLMHFAESIGIRDEVVRKGIPAVIAVRVPNLV